MAANNSPRPVRRLPDPVDRVPAAHSRTQYRSAATRRDIINAAIDLFVDRGYAETRLQDIVERGRVTTGAFYYHFDSKAALAQAIMAEGWPKAVSVIDHCLADSLSPGLERVIVMTFALSSLLKRDRGVWIANHLNQAFGQLDMEGRRGFANRARQFIGLITEVIDPADIRPNLTPEEVGSQVWVMVHGCHLLSDALQDDVIPRLASSWNTLLAGTVHPDSLHYFEQFVARTAGTSDRRVVLSHNELRAMEDPGAGNVAG